MSLESPSGFPASVSLYEINTVVWLQQLSLKYKQSPLPGCSEDLSSTFHVPGSTSQIESGRMRAERRVVSGACEVNGGLHPTGLTVERGIVRATDHAAET